MIEVLVGGAALREARGPPGTTGAKTGGLRYLQRFATVKLGPFPSYPDELEPTSSPNTRRKIVSTCLR
jgi:hypothetical protein